jgi:hypothetical protein
MKRLSVLAVALVLSATACDKGSPTAPSGSTVPRFTADGGFNEGYFLKAVLVGSLLLLFFPERAFKWWRWFAVFAVPYVVWDIATTETHGSGLFAGLGQSPQLSSTIDGGLFLLASLLLALSATIYNHFKLRAKK